MRLRKLMLKDAPLMLEWMHDESVVKYMQADFQSKTEEDCRQFITDSWTDKENLHMAVADDDDVYQGTVSLKHIKDGTAEFAITLHPKTIGKGVSEAAMQQMIEYGFSQMNLSHIYWCVSPYNKRAVRFYDKNGYQRVNYSSIKIYAGGGYQPSQIAYYIWYQKTRKSWKGGKILS